MKLFFFKAHLPVHGCLPSWSCAFPKIAGSKGVELHLNPLPWTSVQGCFRPSTCLSQLAEWVHVCQAPTTDPDLYQESSNSPRGHWFNGTSSHSMIIPEVCTAVLETFIEREAHRFLPAVPKPTVKSVSCVWLFVTPWTVAHQAPLSMELSRKEYWSRLPFPSPGDLPDPRIKPWSPALQADHHLSHQDCQSALKTECFSCFLCSSLVGEPSPELGWGLYLHLWSLFTHLVWPLICLAVETFMNFTVGCCPRSPQWSYGIVCALNFLKSKNILNFKTDVALRLSDKRWMDLYCFAPSSE